MENTKLVIKHELEVLRNSCQEGLDGTWDCSTDEGRNGFEPMIFACEKIAKLIGIELDSYDKYSEEE